MIRQLLPMRQPVTTSGDMTAVDLRWIRKEPGGYGKDFLRLWNVIAESVAIANNGAASAGGNSGITWYW